MEHQGTRGLRVLGPLGPLLFSLERESMHAHAIHPLNHPKAVLVARMALAYVGPGAGATCSPAPLHANSTTRPVPTSPPPPFHDGRCPTSFCDECLAHATRGAEMGIRGAWPPCTRPPSPVALILRDPSFWPCPRGHSTSSHLHR